MKISLTSDDERRLTKMVEEGRYTTEGEAVRDALVLFFEAEARRDALKAKLNAEIQIGLDQIERGETFDLEEVFEEVRIMLEEGQAHAAE